MSDASPLGIFVADGQGGCVYTNAAYQKISGLSFEQALGSDWISAIHPEDRDRVLEDWRAAAKGREPFQTEYRFLQEDGSIVWTRVSSAPMLDGIKPQGRVKTVEDISERKAHEFKLRAAEEALFEERERAQVTLDSIGDAVLSTDLEGRLTYLNRVAEEMTGWPSEDAVGRLLPEVFIILDGTTHQVASNPALHAIRENRDVGLVADCVLVRRDGFECAIEDSAAPIHNRDGQELHITLSIGISVYPDDGVDLDAVLQSADMAMYHAKSNGRNNFQFFRSDMNTRAVRRNSMRRVIY